jgi:hypothetical protein
MLQNQKHYKKSEKKRAYEQRQKRYNNNYKAYMQQSNSHLDSANPTTRFPTLKGELVRSLSEKYVADFLFIAAKMER